MLGYIDAYPMGECCRIHYFVTILKITNSNSLTTKTIPGKDEYVVKACSILHNYLRRNCSFTYSPSTLIEGEDNKGGTVTACSWRNNLPTTALTMGW
ncbi:hypothetical protein PR048_028057 [Dryococelus australis]|uniref:Uncharacterized protein n=1 Tax=Dryococelus australis TaxID=614101 RepID=A0ABQ9GI68_9NEOP|nr:hypothetical protein PR048_028057 [Dryococelus australis]